MNVIDALLDKRLGGFRFGAPKAMGPLALVPVFGGFPSPIPYRLAAEAFAAGTLRVDEIGAGVVDTIAAINDDTFAVLLLDGEHLEGAKQNRILNLSVLLAARSRTSLPVSCVEQGRWDHDRAHYFAPSSEHSYSRLRALQARHVAARVDAGHAARAAQGAVWHEVATKHTEAGVASPTGAMRDAYEGRRGWLSEVRAAFPEPLPEQSGVVACVGGAPVALDAFDRPATLAASWSRLLGGYAMDAIGAAARNAETAADRVSTWFARVRAARPLLRKPLGMGVGVSLDGDGVVGGALLLGDALVHLAMFGEGRRGGFPRRPYFHA